MKYPNIIVLTRNESLLYHQGNFEKFSPYCFYGCLQERFCKTTGDALLIMSQENPDIDNLVEYLIEKNISTLTIIINDVFRARHIKISIPLLSTYTVESDFENTVLEEISISKQIIDRVHPNSYEIYHCEVIPENLQRKLPFEIPIKYFDLFLAEWALLNTPKISFHTEIKYKISSFNKRKDCHRHILCSLLHREKDVLLTFCKKENFNFLLKNNFLPIKDFKPQMRHSILKNAKHFEKEKLRIILNDRHRHLVQSYNEDEFKDKIDQDAVEMFLAIRKSFVNVITETRYNGPFKNISEKSLKPIIAKRPFIMLGPPGNLQMLKDFGFKTFNYWWDEGYDNEYNDVRRFEKVYDLCKKILKTDREILRKQLKEMESVIEHNYKILSKLPINMLSTIGIDIPQTELKNNFID